MISAIEPIDALTATAIVCLLTVDSIAVAAELDVGLTLDVGLILDVGLTLDVGLRLDVGLELVMGLNIDVDLKLDMELKLRAVFRFRLSTTESVTDEKVVERAVVDDEENDKDIVFALPGNPMENKFIAPTPGQQERLAMLEPIASQHIKSPAH